MNAPWGSPPCPRRWGELDRVEGEAAVRFCQECQTHVHWVESMDQARSLGSQGLCVALRSDHSADGVFVGSPRMADEEPAERRLVRVHLQFLLSWEPQIRSAQLRFLLDFYTAEPWAKPLFEEHRSGVRYDARFLSTIPGHYENAREALRERGIALRFDPPEPDPALQP